ncbi:hypothetical protein FHL15_009739 [Xylaria flabelliformis]|uniref:Ribonuclease H1 N-terminal domain-containing protein n=1 Tax=Xylaria flabelliformis TaxID=2512241 RepID=A0A553HMW4_9PEZI|nr:hypothetical protein FHL15_009739 [Xylaria flabelliformis]
MKNEKNFYVIIQGRVSPAVTQSWAVAHPLVNKFPNNKHQSCSTFEEARSILEQHGWTSLWFLEGPTDKDSLNLDLADANVTYAVANGRKIGVFSTYSTGAKPQTDHYSGACHKKLSSPTKAADFLQAFEEVQRRMTDLSLHTDPPAQHTTED